MNSTTITTRGAAILTDYPDVLDVRQVCSILHVSDKSVYKLLRSGALKHVRIGTSYRIPKVYVEQILITPNTSFSRICR